jgi:hypothetical protein
VRYAGYANCNALSGGRFMFGNQFTAFRPHMACGKLAHSWHCS